MPAAGDPAPDAAVFPVCCRGCMAGGMGIDVRVLRAQPAAAALVVQPFDQCVGYRVPGKRTDGKPAVLPAAFQFIDAAFQHAKVEKGDRIFGCRIRFRLVNGETADSFARGVFQRDRSFSQHGRVYRQPGGIAFLVDAENRRIMIHRYQCPFTDSARVVCPGPCPA